jgi:hypothetical protein
MPNKRRASAFATDYQPLHRAYTPFTAQEIELIDSWGFRAQIRNRGDVIHTLTMQGLKTEPAQARKVEARR